MTIEADSLWRRDRQTHWPGQSALVVPYRTTEEIDTTLSLERMRAQIFNMFWGFVEGSQTRPAPGSLAHYYKQVSNNQMWFEDPAEQFVTRGDYFISDDRADYSLAPNQDLGEAMRAKLLEAIDSEVNYRTYTERDNRVDNGDLVLVMVNRSGRGGSGTVRGTETVPSFDGVTLTLRIAAFGNSATFDVAAHELLHVLVSQNTDLYGPGGWNTPASLMGGSPGGGVTHPDGVHKVRLGWQRPRPIDVAMTVRQTLRLLAQTVPERRKGERDPVVIHDSGRSRRDFFLLEYRTPTASGASSLTGGDYESNLDEAGLAVWHAESDGNRYVRRPGYIDLIPSPGRSPSGDDLLTGGGWLSFKPALSGARGVIYAITASGQLLWLRHHRWETGEGGSRNFANRRVPIRVADGRGWAEFHQVVAGNRGVFYCIKRDGSMVWYRHLGWEGGAPTWANGGREARIGTGTGWEDFHQVLAGDRGVFYCIKRDGSMVWYRHLGWEEGAPTWANGGREARIGTGTGWEDFHQVLAGDRGVFYCIKRDGSMVWYRHLGWEHGAPTWANGGREARIGTGTGWEDFHQVLAGDRGVFYCIKRDGSAVWYRHLGWEHGAPTWANGGSESVLMSANQQMRINWGYNATLETTAAAGERLRIAPPINLVAAPKGEYGYQRGFWTAQNGDIQLRWPGGEPLAAIITVAPANETDDYIDVTITPR